MSGQEKLRQPSDMRGCLFFDRDGIVNQSPGAGYVERVEDFHVLPEFVSALRVGAEKRFPAIIVSNQKCVSTGIVSREMVEKIHKRLRMVLARQGLKLLDIYYCPHDGEHPDRKPAPGMLLKAAIKHNIDLKSSWMIGDSERDILAGRAAGCRTVLVKASEAETLADHHLLSMEELPEFLREQL